jgi:hypothetical protein
VIINDTDAPVFILNKPILITTNSNPRVISDFLQSRINAAFEAHFLDETILEMEESHDGPGVLVNYAKINLF